MSRDLFGDNNQYYAKDEMQKREFDERRDTHLENRIRHLFSSHHIKVYERVEQACKQSNLAIRECLRSETALKLSYADRRQSIPYQVIDGMPESISRWIEELPDPILLLLMQKKRLLKKGDEALSLVISHFPDIMRLLGKEDPSERESLEFSRKFLKEILKKIDEFKITDVIREINQDILGAYFFRIPCIEIYWMPIGLFAGVLDVSIEDLTFVVLAHELSHAYTHLGFDIDGVQWETEEFARTEKMIVEGLAQFYTENICKKYAKSQPGILRAFDQLLEKQSPPYTDFKKWTEDHAAEVVRFSLISARSNNIRDYKYFLKEMDLNQDRISVKNNYK